MLRMLPLKCCILSCPAPQISCDSALGQELSQSDYFFFFFFFTLLKHSLHLPGKENKKGSNLQ